MRVRVRQDRWLALIAILLGGGGCAHVGESVPSTAQAGDGHSEIARLEGRIAAARDKAGLPAVEEAADETAKDAEGIAPQPTPSAPAGAAEEPREMPPQDHPPRPGSARPSTGGGSAGAPSAPAAQPAPAAAAPPPPPPTAAETRTESAQPEAASAAPSRQRADGFWSRREHSARCSDVANAATEICHAADGICRIADQLADSDARRRCSHARAECRAAKDAASGC